MMPIEWVDGDLYDAYEERSEHAEEDAWVLCMIGEMWEARSVYSKAARHYHRALQCHPSSKAAFRLCRAEFLMGNWNACLGAYQLGLNYRDAPQVLDDGPVYADSSKLLVAQAYNNLGRMTEARDVARECARLFPSSGAVAELVDSILGGSK